jgi:hypothetical protein
MRSFGLLFVLSLAALSNVACSSSGTLATTATGQRYAAASPVVADAPPMVRRSGPVPSLSQVKASNTEQLEDLLGNPSLRRRDTGVEMWQYAAPECVLLLYLYPNEDGYRVKHLEAHPGGTSDSALDACLRAAATRPIPATS